jgi:hypothetical protein
VFILNRMADRMLNALAPKIAAEASAACMPYQYYLECGCTSGDLQKVKLCSVNSSCKQTCGKCDIVITNEVCSS